MTKADAPRSRLDDDPWLAERERDRWLELCVVAGLAAGLVWTVLAVRSRITRTEFANDHVECPGMPGAYRCRDSVSLPWPVAHFWLTATIVFGAVLIIGGTAHWWRRQH